MITVNLTCMLVLTTMFINVSNNLPTTSYMKMIDVWLLFNLSLPFIVVLLHTYMDTLRDNQEEKNEDNKQARLAIPVINIPERITRQYEETIERS